MFGKTALISILPAVFLVVMGWCVGRFFCLHLCPLGFLQDILPSMRKRFAVLKNIPGCNYLVFCMLFGVSIMFVNVLGSADPIIIFSRAVNAIMSPKAGYRWAFLVPLVGIFLLSIISQRAWCWYVCPLGAFFDGCTNMKKHLCAKKVFTNENPSDGTKRNFMVAAATTSGLLIGAGISPLRSLYADARLIRPPGALPEEDFKRICIRCGNCINVCPTDGLQPTLVESGWDGLFTPRLIPRIGECDEYCRRCGYACPTHAIKPLSLEQKREERIGIARVDKEKCLGWSDNKLCFICGEVCSYLAIDVYRKNKNIPCPVIRQDACRGCGLCEKRCPTYAIKVYKRT
ncbi:MAG: 4Fe-4S binding protein [Candidatus Omnitrophica bacterium]|nr:4Fe-4S binding protein [Candidatus Omnitrophota bacterium]